MMQVMLVQSLRWLSHKQHGEPVELPFTPSSERHCSVANDVEKSL